MNFSFIGQCYLNVTSQGIQVEHLLYPIEKKPGIPKKKGVDIPKVSLNSPLMVQEIRHDFLVALP
jgi:hypothetical protein